MEKKKLLGQLLVEEGAITADQLNKALEIQKTKQPGKKLGMILVEEQILSQAFLVKFLGIQTKSLIESVNNDFDEIDALTKDIT